MKITDELLREHAGEARDLWLVTLPQAVPHTFSARFRRRMKRLLAAQRRTPEQERMRRFARRAAAALVIAAATAFTGLMTVDAYRERFVSVVTAVFRDLTEFRYTSVAPAETGWNEIELTVLPDGMRLVRAETGTQTRFWQYADDAGGSLDLTVTRADTDTVGVRGLDTEHAQVTYGSLRGTKVMKLLKKGFFTYFWDENGLLFELTGSLTENEMDRVAEGITLS